MAPVNTRAKTRRDPRKSAVARLAGGSGAAAAVQNAEQLLRRAVLANLLWEDVAYESGKGIAKEIARLVPHIDPIIVANLAIEARTEQKLRHVPLFLARELARNPFTLEGYQENGAIVAELLPRIILRPDELTEFLAIYWKDGKRPIAAGVKRGLAAAFQRFNAYQLAKYDRDTEIKLRDVLFLVHARPKDSSQAGVWRQLVNKELPIPDTWETALSSGADKRKTWERLLVDGRLGSLAFLRNLRNMEAAKVDTEIIRDAFDSLDTEWLLPLNFLAAAKAAPQWIRSIEDAMFRSLDQMPKLKGDTILVVDVSGSMHTPVSDKSEFSRLDAAAAMAIMAREVCEHVAIFVTAGNDSTRVHKTVELRSWRGFTLADNIRAASRTVGGGGIFTRQVLEYLKKETGGADRTIIFSDSQDCDWPASRVPKPFTARNYIVDISANKRGVAYDGIWTAEISGWSERFLTYIQALESNLGGN